MAYRVKQVKGHKIMCVSDKLLANSEHVGLGIQPFYIDIYGVSYHFSSLDQAERFCTLNPLTKTARTSVSRGSATVR